VENVLVFSPKVGRSNDQATLWYLTARYFQATPTLLESKTVTVPPFAESISEGDVRWEKGNS